MDIPLSIDLPSRVPLADRDATRFVSFNVEFGARSTADDVGRLLSALRPDVVALCEVPSGGWATRVGTLAGLGFTFVGSISSANHRDKYKALLSRTPLRFTKEHHLSAGSGWNPASVVCAEMALGESSVTVGSLHICANNPRADGTLAGRGHSHELVDLMNEIGRDRVVLMGDYNNCIDTPAIRILEGAALRPTWSDLPRDVADEFTYSAVGAERLGVIDHILYRGPSGTRAVAGGIIELEMPLADHKPIWGDIVFGHE